MRWWPSTPRWPKEPAGALGGGLAHIQKRAGTFGRQPALPAPVPAGSWQERTKR